MMVVASERVGERPDWPPRWLDPEVIKREVEKRWHHGAQIPQYRWNRASEELGWPKLKLKTGAAAPKYWESRQATLSEKRQSAP
jgi:hypothetical protein